jgi:hypothetical protein
VNELSACAACLSACVSVLAWMAPSLVSSHGSVATPSTVESGGTPFSGSGAVDGGEYFLRLCVVVCSSVVGWFSMGGCGRCVKGVVWINIFMSPTIKPYFLHQGNINTLPGSSLQLI